jgi:hypothetical protein
MRRENAICLFYFGDFQLKKLTKRGSDCSEARAIARGSRSSSRQFDLL